MNNSFPQVRPGDIISSDLMKFILEKLGEIDRRVTDLESGGSSAGVSITSFDPLTQQAAGQELTVNGVNFTAPPESNTVTIDGRPINQFRPGSTSTRLRFIIPTTLSIPTGGRNVTIRIENANGEASVLYRVTPAVAAPGNPPVITNVNPLTGALIQVNAPIMITGQNFAQNPSENTIRFRLVLQGGEVVYPPTGQTITINPANSNTTQIEATVPDITEINLGESLNVILEVGVGAHVPATRTITIFRLT